MIATIEPVALKGAVKPLVQYFDPGSEQTVGAGEMVHDYYGVPVWLMQEYLVHLRARPVSATTFHMGDCRMILSAAPRKRIGSLEVGGARVEFTGAAGAIQAVLSELEWMTQRW